MQLETPSKKGTKLSLTPLIDVVFLLLIFFMLASTFSRFSSIPLVAKNGQGNAVSTTKFVLVRVDKTGKIDVNGTVVETENLAAKIDSLASSEDMQLVIKATKGASVQQLVTVLEKTKQSKLKNPVVVR